MRVNIYVKRTIHILGDVDVPEDFDELTTDEQEEILVEAYENGEIDETYDECIEEENLEFDY